MATQSVTVVRIYLREGEHQLNNVVKLLHDDKRVLGATVFQGITGFGPDGILRTASLIDLSLDLPLIVEFYGEPTKMKEVINKLAQQFHLPHIVSWDALSHASGE
jgi:PII-like signaling protein